MVVIEVMSMMPMMMPWYRDGDELFVTIRETTPSDLIYLSTSASPSPSPSTTSLASQSLCQLVIPTIRPSV